jgi:predicted Zn-dependent protease
MADNAPSKAAEPREGEPSADAAACFERARERLEKKDTLAALALLERAHVLAPDEPRVRSWLGLLLAQERGQLQRGQELCTAALAQDSSEPEHFMNLARVHLKLGKKCEAIDVLRSGMRQHPNSEILDGALMSLGIRKPVPFGSLQRAHPLNKYTGLLLARLGLR